MITYNRQTTTFTSSLLPAELIHGFGTRMTGSGRDPLMIKNYLDSQRIQYRIITDPEQVHSDRVVLVSSDTSKDKIFHVKECDGLITKNRGIVLTMITADCAPVLYADVKKNIVGISHNGRKGTEKQLTSKMVARMVDLGSEISDLRIAIGPAIGVCCYPVNLIEQNVEQLTEVGLSKNQIDFFPFCTKCDNDRFFSYRGSADKTDFGEQFSFVLLKKM